MNSKLRTKYLFKNRKQEILKKTMNIGVKESATKKDILFIKIIYIYTYSYIVKN